MAPYLCLVFHIVIFGLYIVTSLDLLYKVSRPFKTYFSLIKTFIPMSNTRWTSFINSLSFYLTMRWIYFCVERHFLQPHHGRRFRMNKTFLYKFNLNVELTVSSFDLKAS